MVYSHKRETKVSEGQEVRIMKENYHEGVGAGVIVG